MRSSLLALPILASAVIMATVFGCSSPDSNDGVHITGTATDTENTVVASTSFVGSVKRSDGKAATNVVVRMARMSQETAERAIPTYVEIETDSVGEFSSCCLPILQTQDRCSRTQPTNLQPSTNGGFCLFRR